MDSDKNIPTLTIILLRPKQSSWTLVRRQLAWQAYHEQACRHHVVPAVHCIDPVAVLGPRAMRPTVTRAGATLPYTVAANELTPHSRSIVDDADVSEAIPPASAAIAMAL